MLANWKEKLLGAIKKVEGKTDFLEAVCASAALVATCDGKASDEELIAAQKAVRSNSTLKAAFKDAQIGKTMDSMIERAQSGRTGRAGLYKEIEEIASQPQFAEICYLVALDVAEAEGGIAAQEREALDQIARKLSVNPSSLDHV